MIKDYKIKIERDVAFEDQILEGTLLDTIELNRIARSENGLTYCANIMDEHDFVYMWFKNNTGANYFVNLHV